MTTKWRLMHYDYTWKLVIRTLKQNDKSKHSKIDSDFIKLLWKSCTSQENRCITRTNKEKNSRYQQNKKSTTFILKNLLQKENIENKNLNMKQHYKVFHNILIYLYPMAKVENKWIEHTPQY